MILIFHPTTNVRWRSESEDGNGRGVGTGDATLTQQQQQKRLRRILFEELTHYLHTAAVLDGIRGSELERYV